MAKINVGRDELYAWVLMPHDGERTIEVDKETATRWQQVTDAYYEVLAEIQNAVSEEEL